VLKFLVGNKLDLNERRKVSEEEGKDLGKYKFKEKLRSIICLT
jgi:hypothetical protein